MLAMTLGVAALVNPLRVEDADLLHIPMLAILVALGGVLALAARHRCLDRREGVVLLAAYPAFVLIVLLA
jgi:Ca2+/Na+ antiporter